MKLFCGWLSWIEWALKILCLEMEPWYILWLKGKTVPRKVRHAAGGSCVLLDFRDTFIYPNFSFFFFFKTWLVPYFHISNLVSVNGRLISLGSSFTDRVFTPIGSRLVISGASFLSFQWPAIPTFPHPRPLKRLTKAFREIGVAHWTQTWFYHTSPNC